MALGSIPKGLCPPAQGCEPRATLGELGQKGPTPTIVPPMNPGNIQPPTSNIEHPMPAICAINGCWALDVGGWMFSPFGSWVSQPWALRQNPFGIRLLEEASLGVCTMNQSGGRTVMLSMTGWRLVIGGATPPRYGWTPSKRTTVRVAYSAMI